MGAATVVGSGPNGLAAAVTLARAGLEVRLIEAADTIGGGLRTSELTLPGFHHDECSAVHPLAFASPFFRAFGLSQRMMFVTPEVSYGHPLDHQPAALAFRHLEHTAERLGADGNAWRTMLGPLVDNAQAITRFTLEQLLQVPRHPLATALFGARVIEQAGPLSGTRFHGGAAPALLAGVSAHVPGRHDSFAVAGGGLALAMHAHAAGWPVPVGGSQSIANALADDFLAHGGTIETNRTVHSLRELSDQDTVILDVSPEAFVRMADGRLPAGYERALKRFRRGAGAFKIDFALSEPVPWADPELSKTATVHIGGSRAEIARAEATVANGRHAAHPYVLATQPSLFDPTRAPDGRHTLWAYAHVPNGSRQDLSEQVISQIERFAPGFRDTVLASSARSAFELQAHNPNSLGGDFMGGAVSLAQLVKRPVVSRAPWVTPLPGVFLGSASTPPGPSVHGLCGYYAAREALRRVHGVERMPSLAPEASASS